MRGDLTLDRSALRWYRIRSKEDFARGTAAGLFLSAILLPLTVGWAVSASVPKTSVDGTLEFLAGICLVSGGVMLVLAGSWRGH